MTTISTMYQAFSIKPDTFLVLKTGETCRVIGFRDGFYHLCEYIPEKDGIHMTKTKTLYKCRPADLYGAQILED